VIASPSLDTIFSVAIDLASPADRAAYIARACGDDPALRERVERLVAAHFAAGGFLADAAPELAGAVDQAPAEGPGTVVGPYRLMEQIGEGGMGVVFVAEQQHPVRRKVALKLIKPGMDTNEVVARFEAEQQALALMDHPNIARVLDAGVTDRGRPFFVMELVRGIPVTNYCDRARLGVRARLELFVQVCQAVQHAHQKGVIHRDLKPSNVLVTEHDGTPAAKVIDFGVAKAAGPRLTDRTVYTRFLQLVGSPLYMSPEQAGLSGLDVDTRADIYALGVLLYELLTGTTPFDKDRFQTAGYDEIRQIIREEDPPKPSTRLSTLGLAATTVSANRGSEPRRLSALVRGDLDWVVMRALEKDRNRRYESAAAFALDIQRYLTDEPVLACPPSAAYRFRKFARRNRRAVATATAGAVVVVLGMAGLATSTILIARALTAETEAMGRLADTLKHERVDGYFHRIALAHRELSRDNLGRTREQLDACPMELRQWEWRYLQRLCRAESLVIRVRAVVNGVTFSPRGDLIASAGGDGTVTIWNSKTGKLVQSFPTGADSVYCVAFHPDGKHLASAGADQKVKVWNLMATDRPAFTGPCDADLDRGTAYCVAFSLSGRYLAAGSGGAVKLWDWEREHGQLHYATPIRHARKGISVAFSPDGRWLASAGWDGAIIVWDAESGEPLLTLSEHRHPVSALAFSPDSRRLVSASFDRHLIVWDVTTGERLRTIEAHEGMVLGLAFVDGGTRLVSTGEDKTVRVWEPTTGRELLDLRGHADVSQGVAVSPDSQRAASAGLDGTIRVWDGTPLQGNEAQEAFTLTQPSGEVWTLAIRPGSDGRQIASAGEGAETPVRVWDAPSGCVDFELVGHRAVVFCVAWHPWGQRIATSGWDPERKLFVVKIWDVRARKVSFEVAAGSETFAMAFSPDGDYLVTGSAKGAVETWDARAGREGQMVGTVGTHDRYVRGLAFSHDGRFLASASSDGVVKVWDWDTTRPGGGTGLRHTFRARVPLATLTFAFSPDGRRLVVGGEKNTVKIRDLDTGRELTLDGHTGDVRATAFSPDPEGRWVASAGDDSTVKVWDSRSGELLHSFRGHTGIVTSLAFGPGGRQLFSGSRDHTVKAWDLTHPSKVPGR
jgi:eukaryotic-like serine/threonine-protein kinase